MFEPAMSEPLNPSSHLELLDKMLGLQTELSRFICASLPSIRSWRISDIPGRLGPLQSFRSVLASLGFQPDSQWASQNVPQAFLLKKVMF